MNLSNRQTTSKKIPEIDSLYAYRTRHKAKFTRRHQLGEGYRYKQRKGLLKAGMDEIYIYHQTVEINDIMRGITLVTKNSKFREVQRWFKEQVKEIENNQKLFDKFSKSKSPQEIGLHYMY